MGGSRDTYTDIYIEREGRGRDRKRKEKERERERGGGERERERERERDTEGEKELTSFIYGLISRDPKRMSRIDVHAYF